MDQKILSKIQKLLAMSKDEGSENEAMIALEMAQQLMASNGITEKDVNCFSNVQEQRKSDAPTWMTSLHVTVGNSCGVLSVIKGHSLTYNGDEIGIAVANEFYKYLLKCIRDALHKQIPGASLAEKYRLAMVIVFGLSKRIQASGGWRDMEAKAQLVKENYFSKAVALHTKSRQQFDQQTIIDGMVLAEGISLHRQAYGAEATLQIGASA